MKQREPSGIGRVIDELEETLIALFLGLMTVFTFANVVARYVFNLNILWALEATVTLFAWLVLLGISYGVKKNIHIGVDVLVNIFPPHIKKLLTLLAVGLCVLYAGMCVKGALDYWLPFIGFQAFMETNDMPMPSFLQFFADILNDGERYEKVPRFIPYFVLPLGMALLTFRFLQAGWYVLTDQQDLIITGHEAEELIDDTLPHEARVAEKD